MLDDEVDGSEEDDVLLQLIVDELHLDVYEAMLLYVELDDDELIVLAELDTDEIEYLSFVTLQLVDITLLDELAILVEIILYIALLQMVL